MKQLCRGFTLIEALTFLFMFSVISLALYQAFTLGTQHILDAKSRLGATALANQKMEIILSIPFDDVGTKRWNGSTWVYGIPAGDILEDETIMASRQTFEVHTFVQYVDDPYDQSSPADLIPTDYKRIRLTITWGDGSPSRTVSLVSTVAGVGVESASNSGVLSINVLDATGAGVSQATVRVVNTSASIDLTATTDAFGNLTLPGAPPGTQNYRISVSKSGHYGASSLPPYPTTAYDPVDEDTSVVIGSVNQYSMVMDQEVDFKLVTNDPFGQAVPNIDYSLSGGRLLGSDPATNPATNVFSFSDTSSTNGSGEKQYTDEHYGTYVFTLAPSETEYELISISPPEDTVDAFLASPGQDQLVTVTLADKSVSSLLVTVKNATTDAVITGATVQVTDTVSGYDTTLVTDNFGRAFFPTTSTPLVAGSYTVETTATGFQSDTASVNIDGTGLELETISLTLE